MMIYYTIEVTLSNLLTLSAFHTLQIIRYITRAPVNDNRGEIDNQNYTQITILSFYRLANVWNMYSHSICPSSGRSVQCTAL